MIRQTLLALAIAGSCTLAVQSAIAAETPDFYRLQSVLKLQSSNSAWDHIDFDPVKKYAYLSRRKDGLTVVDVTQGKVVAQVAQTQGTNSTALVPKYDRAYTSNEDGSMTIFKLSDFSVLARVSFADNADGNVYDPASDSIAFMQADDSLVVVADAASGKIRGKIKVDGKELERPIADGKGNIFIPLRDKHAVVKVDLKALKVVANWDVAPQCTEPSAGDYDAGTNRLLLGCRGGQLNPAFVAVDGASGRPVASLPLGRGTDGLVFDPTTKQIFAASGLDGNMVAYRQQDADHYAMAQAFQTRPGARGLVYDPQTQRIYTMTAEGAVDPAKKVLKGISPFYPNSILPNTFVMLTYARNSAVAQ